MQCLPAVLLSYGTRDGEGERWRTLGETAVVTELKTQSEREREIRTTASERIENVDTGKTEKEA